MQLKCKIDLESFLLNDDLWLELGQLELIAIKPKYQLCVINITWGRGIANIPFHIENHFDLTW